MIDLKAKIDNPYGEEVLKYRAVGSGSFMSFDYEAEREAREAKGDLCKKYSLAIPGLGALSTIAGIVSANNLPGIVEIGAGSGYWAYCLSQYGIEVHAYDSFAWDCHREYRWYPVEAGGPPAVQLHQDCMLFLCWPPMSCHKPAVRKLKYRFKEGEYKAMRAMEKHICGDKNMGGKSVELFTSDFIAYVGEGGCGCTGDAYMHRQIVEDFIEIAECPVPQWPGLHDHLYIYRRKSSMTIEEINAVAW